MNAKILEMPANPDMPPKAEVIDLPCITKLNLDPEKILRAAADKIGEGVVIVGWDKEGELYFASSYASGLEVLWLFEKAKVQLMRI